MRINSQRGQSSFNERLCAVNFFLLQMNITQFHAECNFLSTVYDNLFHTEENNCLVINCVNPNLTVVN